MFNFAALGVLLLCCYRMDAHPLAAVFVIFMMQHVWRWWNYPMDRESNRWQE